MDRRAQIGATGWAGSHRAMKEGGGEGGGGGAQACRNHLICVSQEFSKMIVPADGEAAQAKRKGAFHTLSAHQRGHRWTRGTEGARPPDWDPSLHNHTAGDPAVLSPKPSRV